MTPLKTALPSYTTAGATLEGPVFVGEGAAMGAEVLGCGHAYHLFHEVSYMEGAPQVHLHFLTDDAEFRAQGFGKLELCCHGCGASKLVYYNGNGTSVRVRDGFKKAHKDCKNRGFELGCPDYRSSVDIVDLRIKTEKKRSGRSRVRARRR